MELWQVPRVMNRMMNEMMRDFDRFDRSIYPYWRDADHSVLHVANETQQVVDDDKKFAVSLDVSQFRPEELNVHLEGRELTIEGKQEHKNDHSFMQRSFIRKWTLPESVNLEALHTQLSDKGHLCVEAPKTTEQAAQRRNIPIMAAKSNK
ncbi:Hsp20/alpha crystallin family protein [Ancylostoma caninum]|uniref:Hsp20/alpha crystallin family protein n=1 Tax=Ancylostoma caninum TaxID=29170 RepID=A0A368H0K0_ANCCA|nr:Hsp20/alpha crystallin family protein [Ancylostoma caninum]